MMKPTEILDYDFNDEQNKADLFAINITYEKVKNRNKHLSYLMFLLVILLFSKLMSYLNICYDRNNMPHLICILAWVFVIGYLTILGFKYRVYTAAIGSYLKSKTLKDYQKLWETKIVLNRYMLFFWILPILYIALFILFGKE